MLPVLLDLKFLKIYTFGVFVVLAFFWGCYLLWKNVRLTQYKEEDVFDGLFWSLAAGLFFGRVLHVALNFSKFGLNPLKFILLNGYPGISLFGFIGGFLLASFIYCNLKKISFRELADYIIPSALVALAFGKVGSFFAGVEVGAPTSFPVAVKYALTEGKRHLTPLYEGLIFAVAAYLATKILFAIRRGRFEQGFNFYFFLWFFAAVTAAFDPLKSHHLRFFGVSFNTAVSAVLLLTFSLYFLYYFRMNLAGGITRGPKILYGKLFNKNVRSKAESEAAGGTTEDTG